MNARIVTVPPGRAIHVPQATTAEVLALVRTALDNEEVTEVRIEIER